MQQLPLNHTELTMLYRELVHASPNVFGRRSILKVATAAELPAIINQQIISDNCPGVAVLIAWNRCKEVQRTITPGDCRCALSDICTTIRLLLPYKREWATEAEDNRGHYNTWDEALSGGFRVRLTTSLEEYL